MIELANVRAEILGGHIATRKMWIRVLEKILENRLIEII
jgi:hypothetical protein